MPEREDFLTGLRDCYRAYGMQAEELERRRRPGEGIFGMKGGPKDDPCHGRFAEELRTRFAEYRAAEPDSAELRQVLTFVFREPLSYRGPRSAYWMLLAVQGLTLDLIPGLQPEDAAALAASYEKDYPRSKRLPVQEQLLRKLRQRAGGA